MLSFKETSVKISGLLKKEFVLEHLKAKSKQEALAELAGVFEKGEIKCDSGAILRILMEREKLGSTGIGDGIAIPHGKLAGLDEIMVAFGRSRKELHSRPWTAGRCIFYSCSWPRKIQRAGISRYWRKFPVC